MQYIPSNGGCPSREPEKDWFEQRRDWFVRRLVSDFFHLIRSFQEMYTVYLDCCQEGQGRACPDLLGRQSAVARERIWLQLDTMVGTEIAKGPLWQLKDLCHRLWPKAEACRDVNGSFLDWLIGSVFHEAMKLKENIYLLNRYGPEAFRKRDLSAAGSGQFLRPAGTFPEMTDILDMKELLSRIDTAIVNQIEQVGFFFGQANFMLRMMMPAFVRNMLVLRLLVEQEDTVQVLWGESLEVLFGEMFSGNPAAGFCAAGRSYMGGQWYSLALAMYRRALQADRSCDEAMIKMVQLEKILEENDHLLTGADPS